MTEQRRVLLLIAIMAAVLGIVRGHQGDIQVASQVGGGSRFKVLLPVSVALHSPVPPRRTENDE